MIYGHVLPLGVSGGIGMLTSDWNFPQELVWLPLSCLFSRGVTIHKFVLNCSVFGKHF